MEKVMLDELIDEAKYGWKVDCAASLFTANVAESEMSRRASSTRTVRRELIICCNYRLFFKY